MSSRGVRDEPAPPPEPDQDLRRRLDALPASHPSSPRYVDGQRLPPRPARRDVPPLTDREYEDHTRLVETRLADAESRGLATDIQYTTDPARNVWKRDRVDAQQGIIDEIYSAAAAVPCEGRAIIAGGLGGAGKSTVLAGAAGIDRSRYLTINPDEIKEKMAERGMIPQVPGLSPMECSHLVHEESSLIAGRLAEHAMTDRKNVIWDITMSSRPSVERRLTDLREAGYRDVSAIFVDIPVQTSVRRALARHRAGLESYRNGDGLGGRYVPPGVIREQQAAGGGSVNREVFDGLRDRFSRWSVYDNSADGRDAVLTGSSEHDRERA